MQFVAKATERGAADKHALDEIRTAAFDEGAEAPLLARRFKDVAFPEDAGDREDRLRQQIAAAARRPRR